MPSPTRTELVVTVCSACGKVAPLSWNKGLKRCSGGVHVMQEGEPQYETLVVVPKADYEALEARVRELIAAGELLDLAAVAFADVLRGFPADAAYRKGIHNADDAHSRWLTALAAFNAELSDYEALEARAEELVEAIEKHRAWMDERFKGGDLIPNEVDTALYLALAAFKPPTSKGEE